MLAVLVALSESSSYSCPLSISYSTFKGLHSSTSGGAIYLSATGCNLLAQNCIFCSDTAAAYGGAIYIIGTNISCITTCFTNCSASSYGLVIYSSTSYTTISIAEFSNSFSLSSSSERTLCIISPYLLYSHINTSLNYAAYVISGIWAQCTTFRFGSFSSFNNNTDGQGATIDLQGSASVSNFTFSNYIGNSPGSIDGLIWTDSGAQGTFVDCVFLSNGATAIAVNGVTSNPKYPTFCNCIFDIPSSRLSSCTLYSCSLNVSFATQVQNSVLQHEKCQNMNQTDAFTQVSSLNKCDPLLVNLMMLTFITEI